MSHFSSLSTPIHPSSMGRHPTLPFTLKLLLQDLSEIQVQTLTIAVSTPPVHHGFQSKAKAPWIKTDLLLAHLLPLPYTYSSLTSNRKAGRSVVFAMLFSPFDQTQLSFHLVNCYTPFKAPVESNSSRKPSLTLLRPPLACQHSPQAELIGLFVSSPVEVLS